MPRHQKAMKDVASCEKLRGGAEQPLIRRYPNGATQPILHFVQNVISNFQFTIFK